ncbi:xanthine/uracil permease family protein [Wolffia australiana]
MDWIGGARRGGGRGSERPGPWPPSIEPFVPRNADLSPRELKSWARRTGFNPNLSGETSLSSLSDREVREREAEALRQPPRPAATAAPTPFLARGRGSGANGELAGEIRRAEPVAAQGVDEILNGGVSSPERGDKKKKKKKKKKNKKSEKKDEPGNNATDDLEMGVFSGGEELERPPAGPKLKLTDTANLPYLALYGLQHFLSLAGSLVFFPLILVPAMGGTDEQTAAVISTMLLVSGLTTLLHSFLGTRLPLVQGSSFVYLAPALLIANSEEFRNLSENKFKHIMRELQGAIMAGSLCQVLLGYSGLMSLLLRWINPVVVAPTVAAIGLAYFSYGFPQAGNCVEVSVPQLLLVLLFTLHLRKVSIGGHRIFLIFAVPLSVAVVWACAFFLTTGGAYGGRGCSPGVPSSNVLLDACRRHAAAVRSCRTDVSGALRAAAWVRVPYPLQWGVPSFRFETAFIMLFAGLVASVDSVGCYHAAAELVGASPPSAGVVTRGIGLEGCASMLAGLWGTGAGATTLTENLHTIDATGMASRRALQLGAAVLVLFSLLGKVGALLASIPPALAAAALCFTWSLVAAQGLSALRRAQAASPRNMIIVGFALFISLSVPAYLQQYEPLSRLILPGYLLPYAAASSGPVRLGGASLSYAMNGVLSLNAVVAAAVALALDNTVPGSRKERGAYVWSESSPAEYALPPPVAGLFKWVKWVG